MVEGRKVYLFLVADSLESCEVPAVSRYGEWCILDAAKIEYCFGQVTSVTDDLS